MGCVPCSSAEGNDEKKFQDLSGWKPTSLNRLRNQLIGRHDNDEARVYTVASTRFKQGIIRHEGSGPNLEGKLATLCTCKRSMRASQTSDYWEGKWILGLTSRAKSNGFNGSHYFLYLMRVGRAFDSHYQLYHYLKKCSPNSLQIKNAVTNPFGDIYEPEALCDSDPRNPRMYKSPHTEHSHVPDEWEDDIISTPLLLGDVANTFVWQEPMIRFKENRGCGNKKFSMRELLSDSFVENV